MKVTIAFSLLFLTFSAMGQTFSDRKGIALIRPFLRRMINQTGNLLINPFLLFLTQTGVKLLTITI